MKKPGKNIKWTSKDNGLEKAGGLQNQKKIKKNKNFVHLFFHLFVSIWFICLVEI